MRKMVYYDSHCHLSPDIIRETFDEKVRPILLSQTWPINLMMTNHIDKSIILSLLNEPEIMQSGKIMINLGVHPWFSHLYTDETNCDDKDFKRNHYKSVLEVYSHNREHEAEIDDLINILPNPININSLISEFKEILSSSKFKSMINIGEIGIDKLSRIPNSGFLGNQSYSGDCKLSNYKIKLDHQIKIMKIQMELAVSLNEPKKMSIHCVGGHGVIHELLTHFSSISESKISVVMHSYSGSLENGVMISRLPNVNLWFGISDVVNLSRSKNDKLRKLANVLSDKIMVETDLGIDRMLDEHISEVEKVISGLESLGLPREKLLSNWVRYLE